MYVFPLGSADSTYVIVIIVSTDTMDIVSKHSSKYSLKNGYSNEESEVKIVD